MTDFKADVHIGTIPGGSRKGGGPVVAEIRYVDNRLTIGVGIGKGDDMHTWTRTVPVEDLTRIRFSPGWDRAKVNRLSEITRRWHLNDMRAGSPRQEAWIQENRKRIEEKAKYPNTWYDAVLDLMPEDINPDDGYRYGTAWNYEEVPEEILEEIREMAGISV